jgi:hypothetical protein
MSRMVAVSLKTYYSKKFYFSNRIVSTNNFTYKIIYTIMVILNHRGKNFLQ